MKCFDFKVSDDVTDMIKSILTEANEILAFATFVFENAKLKI